MNTVNYIKESLERKKCMSVCLDIQQVFDKVWHQGLSYLNERHFKVVCVVIDIIHISARRKILWLTHYYRYIAKVELKKMWMIKLRAN